MGVLTETRGRFTGADRGVDAWAQRTAADTAASRSSASSLVASAQSSATALAPYSNTVPGRVALMSSMSDHAGQGGRVVSTYGSTLPARRGELQGLLGQFAPPPPPAGIAPPSPLTPAPPPPRRRRRRRRRGAPRSRGRRGGSQFRLGGGGGGGGMPRFPGIQGMGGSGMGGMPNFGSLLGGGGGGGPRRGPGPMPGGPPGRADSMRGALVNAAAEKLGTIYLWGGKGGPADGGRVDCSGLTGYAYRKFGMDIGPDTFSQIAKGVQISPRDIKPGDLIFSNFGSQGGNPGPGHVVMATGYGENSRIIEAPGRGQPVAIGNMPSGRIVVKRYLSD